MVKYHMSAALANLAAPAISLSHEPNSNRSVGLLETEKQLALQQASKHWPITDEHGNFESCVACDWKAANGPENLHHTEYWAEHIANLAAPGGTR
jgi:hypothetical protein